MNLTKQQIGKTGEKVAADYLIRHGYRIIERNWRCRSGEIDIIAAKNSYVIFVEVRTRRTTSSYGKPQESVDYRKQHQVRKTANVYLFQHGLNDVPLRFDVMSIVLKSDGTATIEHIMAAF